MYQHPASLHLLNHPLMEIIMCALTWFVIALLIGIVLGKAFKKLS
jgi:hypothetical protein